MPRYWLISDRDKGGTGTGRNVAGLGYFVSDGGAFDDIVNWRKVSLASFQKLLADTADQFPEISHDQNENKATSPFSSKATITNSATPTATAVTSALHVDPQEPAPVRLPGLGSVAIPGAYFAAGGTIGLMRQFLRVLDRSVLEKFGVTKDNAWHP